MNLNDTLTSELVLLTKQYGQETIWAYTLANGKFYESSPLTSEEQKSVRKRITSLNRQFVKDSFINSSNLALSDSKGKIKYVEGFIYIKDFDIAFLHAWNEINGKVIDTTLKTKDEGRNFGSFDENISYMGTVLGNGNLYGNNGKSVLLAKFPRLQ